MKIRLTVNLPIEKKHGAIAGRVFEVVKTKGRTIRTQRVYFKGDAGDLCAAFWRECEEVRES
jgi:hypothetical protein